MRRAANTLPPSPSATFDGGKCCPNPEQLLLATTSCDETLLAAEPYIYSYNDWDTASEYPDTYFVTSVGTDTNGTEPADMEGGGGASASAVRILIQASCYAEPTQLARLSLIIFKNALLSLGQPSIGIPACR